MKKLALTAAASLLLLGLRPWPWLNPRLEEQAVEGTVPPTLARGHALAQAISRTMRTSPMRVAAVQRALSARVAQAVTLAPEVARLALAAEAVLAPEVAAVAAVAAPAGADAATRPRRGQL